ncbi:type II secretion system F family protein [Candidatus Parcubacteria bacterium]|nr:type II secretion system F family protein [Candidatus Parcubacteria bacterium]
MIKKLLKIKKIFRKLWGFGFFGAQLSFREQAYFTSRLSFLIGAEISLTRSLEMLLAQSRKEKEKKMLRNIISDVFKGDFLSTSLAHSRPKFNKLAVQIIKTGEMTGTLCANLQHVSNELKKRQLLWQKIIGALFYPLCIGVATIGVTGMITLYILPKITPIFSSLNAKLPLSTRILLGFHATIVEYGIYLVIMFLIIVFTTIFCFKKYDKFRIQFELLYLKIPLFGAMLQYYEVAQTFRTLGLLLKSNVPLKDALQNISFGCLGAVYKKEYLTLSEFVTQGMPMSRFLATKPALFPLMVSQMLSVGESSGNLVEVSIYISEYFERELDEIIKKLGSSLEPILMVVMGVIVGFVAISVITPIYEITQNIKK